MIPRKLTRKQEKLARARVADTDATLEELGLRAGYKATPRQAAWRALSSAEVKARVRELMDESPRLRVPALLTKLEEGLDAHETKFFAFQGRVTDSRDCIDFPTRLGYLDKALELQGLKEKQVAAIAVPLTKDSFDEFCDTYWASKARHLGQDQPKPIESDA